MTNENNRSVTGCSIWCDVSVGDGLPESAPTHMAALVLIIKAVPVIDRI
jgi:hypothetical protein